MFDHLGITVADFDRSKIFYQKALAPLSITLLTELTAADTGTHAYAGFGRDGKPVFWIGDAAAPRGTVHIAFGAPSRDDVKAFYRAALAAGARDNGAPGPRPHYHANYFGAFVLDPDGNNIEAVCHKAESAV
jgi:catechol 2,3-dioxygenase-like lactoylglutathione lyase family enzyme